MRITGFLLSVALVCLSGCTAAGIAVANLPAAFSKNNVVRDIAYGDEAMQKLDLYVPDRNLKTDADDFPVIIFFYGGRWTEGKKSDYAFVGDALASRGYITVIPDYRKYPKVRFPAFVEDGAKAASWVYENINNYHGDRDLIFISGHSAGAHIAALLVADKSYLADAGQASSMIKGMTGLAGPYDFTPEEEDLKEIFGPPEQYPQMQATTFIDGSEPPLLLLQGDQDSAVGAFNLEKLARKIRSKNGAVETKIYEDVNHVEIVGAFSWYWRKKAPVIEDVTTFFDGIANEVR